MLVCPAGSSIPCPLYLHGRGGDQTGDGDGSRVVVEDAAGGRDDGYEGDKTGSSGRGERGTTEMAEKEGIICYIAAKG